MQTRRSQREDAVSYYSPLLCRGRYQLIAKFGRPLIHIPDLLFFILLLVLVHARLTHILPAPIAIGLTAVLFLLKHALGDASLGRFLALIAFGAICGVVAHHNSWRDSAALHLVVNTVGTITGLISVST